MELWKDYLEYAARVKATKRWRKIVTRALRLHPTEVSLWVMAAARAAEDGDVDGARSLFMRGCRFCSSGCTLWVEYARMEMQWLAKMERKNKGSGKKGHEGSMATHAVQEGDIMLFEEDDEDEFGQDDDNVLIPEPTRGTQSGKAVGQSNNFEDAMKKIEKSPALEGAIPRAIFDVAKKQSFWSADAGEAFFDMFSEFVAVSTQSAMIEHVLDAMKDDYPTHPSTCSCLIRQPLIGVEPTTVEYPKALREVLARIKTQMDTTKDKARLAEKTLAWIKPLLARKDLDASLRTVLEHTKSKLETS